MNTRRPFLIPFCLLLLLFAKLSSAAITVTPTKTTVGKNVTATVSRTFTQEGIFQFRINFGDGSPTVFSGNYKNPGTHSFTVSHSYSKPGTYTITGQSFILTGGLSIPITQSKSVRIIKPASNSPTTTNTTSPPSVTSTPIHTYTPVTTPTPLQPTASPMLELPRGAVGQEYHHNISSSLSTSGNRYRALSRNLPPGIKIQSNGLLTGIPTRKGRFTFSLQVMPRSGSAYTLQSTIIVDPGTLGLGVTPNVIQATRGRGTSQKVYFSVTSPDIKINDTARSSRGEFSAAGRTIGYINRPLNINLNSLQPTASENIQIPAHVLRNAQNIGTSTISYRRTFTATNFESASGETKIDMRTAAGGDLRFTKLRVFFEQNNRPIITVDRNSNDLRGVIEIHYNGSGAFKGYWKVDDRILQRVQKNVFYGKVLTLKTPSTPQLPTYSEGAHRLQFIITEPQAAVQKIDFPEAIYHVEAKKAEFIARITLKTPVNKAQVDPSLGGRFTWTVPSRIDTCLVEFLEEDGDEPFFTAYTKEGSYSLAARLINLKFKNGDNYRWRVRGFNNQNMLVAESSEQEFMLLE